MNKTKRKIFETSMKLFAEKGYDATSIEEITATVGVAKGTLYYHFSSKEEIFNFLVEEGMKLLMVYLFGYKNQEFDETYDIIVYSVFVSLGFAAFENIIYILSDGGMTIGIIRGLMAVPSHAFDALFMGYYLSLAKVSSMNNNKQLEKKNIFKSLMIPTILHGIYDFCLLSGSIPLIIFCIVFIIFLYIVSINKLNYVVKNNIKLIKKNTN